MPSSAAGTKVASSMPPFHPEEAALSRHISLNTKATCAQPLARAPRIGKVSGESFARPFFAVAHGHFRFSPKAVVAYAFCRFAMSHSHPSASLVLLGAQNRSVSRLVFQNQNCSAASCSARLSTILVIKHGTCIPALL